MVEHFGCNLRHRSRVDAVGDEVSNHSSHSGCGQAPDEDHLILRNSSAVKTYVSASRLVAIRNSEFVNASSQLTHVIEGGGARVGNDCEVRIVESLPRRLSRIELQPDRSERKMVWSCTAAHSADTVSYSLNATVLSESLSDRHWTPAARAWRSVIRPHWPSAISRIRSSGATRILPRMAATSEKCDIHIGAQREP